MLFFFIFLFFSSVRSVLLLLLARLVVDRHMAAVLHGNVAGIAQALELVSRPFTTGAELQKLGQRT